MKNLNSGGDVGTATVINGTADSFTLTNHTDKFSIDKNGKITLKVPAKQLTETPYTINFYSIDENGNNSNTAKITINVKS